MQFGYFCFVSLFQFRVLVVCSAFFSAVLSGGETNFAANTWNQKKRVRIVIFWFKYVIRCVNTKAHRQINMSFTCLVFVIKRLLLLQYICGAMTVYVAYCFACLYVVLCCFVIFCNEYRKSLCHNDAVFTAPSLSLSLRFSFGFSFSLFYYCSFNGNGSASVWILVSGMILLLRSNSLSHAHASTPSYVCFSIVPLSMCFFLSSSPLPPLLPCGLTLQSLCFVVLLALFVFL